MKIPWDQNELGVGRGRYCFCGFLLLWPVVEFSCFPGDSVVKNHLPMQEIQETRLRSLGWEEPLEKGMATQSSILA